jgi:predicted glycosyltransferase
VHVPKRAVDALSLLAAADLVVSAGGTMNREAAALGTPVYTMFAGRLGAVDEALIRAGRLRPLSSPDELDLRKRDVDPGDRIRRDPRQLLELLLEPA